MAMDIIPKALYPLVPNAPGVPPVLRNVVKIADAATLGFLGLSDALDALIGAESPQWGIFTASGEAVAIADAVLSLDYRNDSRISDYPVEKGAFASYNKVADPYSVRVRMVRGGTEQDRSDFIAAIEAAATTLDLFEVRTPEMIYPSANIEGFDYRRETVSGAGKIIAEVRLREIRQPAAVTELAPKQPAAAGAQSMGQVQTQAVPYPVIDVRGLR